MGFVPGRASAWGAGSDLGLTGESSGVAFKSGTADSEGGLMIPSSPGRRIAAPPPAGGNEPG